MCFTLRFGIFIMYHHRIAMFGWCLPIGNALSRFVNLGRVHLRPLCIHLVCSCVEVCLATFALDMSRPIFSIACLVFVYITKSHCCVRSFLS